PRRAVGGTPPPSSPPPAPSSIRRGHRVVVEVDMAVGLRPQADAAGNRLRQDVLELELAVQVAFDPGAGQAHLDVMPLARRGSGVSWSTAARYACRSRTSRARGCSPADWRAAPGSRRWS